MNAWALAYFAIGYLIGMVSGSRLVAARVIPGVPLRPTRVVLGECGTAVVVDRVSPSMVGARAGNRAGLIAAAIDIAKGVVPVFLAQVLVGEGAAALVAMGIVVGHVLPLPNPLQGGFGMSPILGAMLVLDPLGLAVVLAVGILVATVIGSPFFGTEVWVAFLPLWGWYRADWWLVGFATVAAIPYFWTSRHEMVGAFHEWRIDRRPWLGRWSDYWEYPIYEAVDQQGAR